MTKTYCVLITLPILLLTASVKASAQDIQSTPGARQMASCDHFKMKVVIPGEELDYKLRMVKPAEGIDYKGKVIAPCPAEGRGVAKALPVIPYNGRRVPLIAPSFRRLPTGESTLKSPSEMLKKFATPSVKPNAPK